MKKTISFLLVLAMLVGLMPATLAAASRERPTASGDQAALALLGAQESTLEPLDTKHQPDPQEMMTIIVILDESRIPDHGHPSKYAITQMKKEQKSVIASISDEVMGGEPVKVNHTYHILTNGFSMDATYAQLQEIRKLDGVVSAYEAPSFKLMPNMHTSNEMVGGGVYNKTGYTGAGTVVAILDTGVDLNHEVFEAAPENPRLTVEEIQKRLDQYDMNCEAIVPGVGADTLYHSAKIPFQFDYGEKDADGNPPAQDGEHGTHVAATTAANSGVKEGFSGVAPDAQIVNMKVFQKGGGATFDDVIAALEDCVVLGVDAANLSLGSDCGFIDFESPDEWTQNLLNVFHRTGENGVCLSVAVGNAYSAARNNNYGGKALASNPDYGNASMPATFDESLAVAATENAGMMAPYITVNDRKIAYYDGYDFDTSEVTTQYALRTIANKGTLEYVPVPGAGKAEDYEGLDVKGKIALVSRGEITYEEKAGAAADAGAVAMVVYNNVSGMVYMSIAQWRIPIGFVSKQDGAYMLSQENKKLTIGTSDALVPSPVAGMCDFSSWGATSELTLKPEITAPGGNIYSAVPGNQYELMSGTSMAAPHVAGAMAIVRKAMAERHPELTAGQIKDLVDTVLMSTAQIIYDGETPVSPRKQGAGLMNINSAVDAKAYLTVANMERPKLELGDDENCTGVYNLTVTVHNDSDKTRYYQASPIVLTDKTTTENGVTLMTETDVALPHTFTTNHKDNLVSVAPGGTAEVTVTVTLTDPAANLAAFTNGAFVEGWVCLHEVAADGGAMAEGVDLNAPFLTFYGDWTKAPMFDSAYWWDVLKNEETDAQVWPNEALLSSMENTYHTYLGANNYDVTIPYIPDRNAISPNEDDFMDSLSYVHSGLLRSARYFTYNITGEDGTVYYEKTIEYNSKSVYNDGMFSIVPAGAVRDFGDAIDPWYGTDDKGFALPNNTKATVTVSASPVYNAHESNNVRDSWSFPITVDTETPEVLDMEVRESESRYYATVTVKDNQYVAALVLTDSRYSKEYAVYGVGELEAGKTTVLKDLDVTGLGETIGVVLHDYAGNTKTYYLHAHGNTDDYADVVVTPDMVLYSENFDDAWLPAGWSQSPKASAKTWYRDQDRWAAIDFDETFPQDEWLYSPAYDLSGQDTQLHAIFTFNTSYTYCVQYPHFNVQVMISADDGSTWEPIWSLKDCGLYNDWESTQAKVVIPDEYQGLKAVRFAFVYTGDTKGASYAFDDFIIYKDRAENYVAVQADAGANGKIQPSGRVLIRKGNSRTFTATADEGYEVESLLVDGKDMGPIGYYTFEKVGVDHTISASFRKADETKTFRVEAAATEGGTITPMGALEVQPGASQTFDVKPNAGYRVAALKVNGRDMGRLEQYTLEDIRQNYYVEAVFEKNPDAVEVIFEQDFEGSQFAPEGWNLQGTDNTWRQGSYYYLNKTKQAYISYAEGVGQDEWLISPEVNLSGATQTLLEFDFACAYYPLRNGDMTLRLMASADGGSNWTELWNATEALNDTISGYAVVDRAFVELPQEMRTQNVKFAWNFIKPAASDAGIAAVDNVKLNAAGVSTDPEGYAKITATAGEGGTITPEGKVYVKNNENQTFTMTPMTGYVVKDVVVDGTSVGAVTSYTFEQVTKAHTIHAEFALAPTDDGTIFENDFEDAEFPSRGWSVESKSSSRNHWEKGNMTALNATSVARVVNDYEDWSNAPAQDEWLVSPQVDLTGKNAVLEFDTKLGRYELLQGNMGLKVCVSTDGGTVWDTLWDAQNAFENEGGMYIGGHVAVEIPAAYQKDNVKLAFQYTKKNGYEGDWVGVDNVVLSAPVEQCKHEQTEILNAVDATCTEDGYTGDEVCTVCHEVVKKGSIIPKLGHSFTSYVSDGNATCMEDGTKTAKCDRCEETHTVTDEGSALGHSFTNYVSDENATCTEDGTKTAKCDRCEETHTVTDEGSALGHSFTNYVSDGNATCTEDGTKTAKCDRCEETHTVTDEGSALGHSFTNYVSDENATCTEDGTKTAKCDRCEETHTVTDEGSALGHSFTNYVSDGNATCTEDGTKTAKCDRCEETHTVTDEGSALGHDWGQWKQVEAPTPEKEGKEVRECARCHGKEERAVPKLPAGIFEDVFQEDYYYVPVYWAVEKGITEGVSETRFAPNSSCTRAQMVTFLWRSAGCPEPAATDSPFTDLKDDYYTKAVLWAVEKGITNGVGGGRFAPNSPCTREQAVTFLWRAQQCPEPQTVKNPFNDVDETSEHYKAILWAVENQITDGVGGGRFSPRGRCTRGQMVTFLYRVYAQ